jgi:hypothetical protein
MKKVLLLALFFTFVSCTNDEEKDCNCNRVVEVITMNIVAGNGQVGVTKFYKYTTINDCTGIQRESGFTTEIVTKGQCK